MKVSKLSRNEKIGIVNLCEKTLNMKLKIKESEWENGFEITVI